jgi:hypothetical protein
LPAAVTAAAHFPGVDLMDGHVQSADLNDAGPHSANLAAGQTRAEPIRTAPPGTEHPGGQAGAEHPSSAESDHSSTPWWQKSPTQPGPTRTP